MTDVKRVLAIGFSQTGQLSSVLESILGPLRASAEIEVTELELEPVNPVSMAVLAIFRHIPRMRLRRTGADPRAEPVGRRGFRPGHLFVAGLVPLSGHAGNGVPAASQGA